jgi:DNA-binding XRE family transcriptional regulator
VVILPTLERLALPHRDTLLALESCVDRLAAQVADLQSLLRRARRRADRRTSQPPLAQVGIALGALPHTLADRRRALGMSQRAVARAVGYSRSEVSELERGTRHNPETLRCYADALERLEYEVYKWRTGPTGPTAPGAPASPTPSPSEVTP